MKKIILILTVALSALFSSSCQKDEPGAVEAKDLCGQWYVTIDGADAKGEIIEDMEDPYDIGRFLLLTYNTADNNTTDIYVDDLYNGWGMRSVVKADINTLTFSCKDAENDYYDGEDFTCTKFTITGGKIVMNGTTTPSGQPADYIEFFVAFDDDTYVGEYYDQLKISGWRYTGLANDD